MDAWLLVTAAGVDLICLAIAIKAAGWLYAMVGATVMTSAQGYLVSSQAINIGSIVGTCVPGPTVGPNCGYALSAGDVQIATIVLAILTVASWLVVIDLVWPGRPTAQGAYH